MGRCSGKRTNTLEREIQEVYDRMIEGTDSGGAWSSALEKYQISEAI